MENAVRLEVEVTEVYGRSNLTFAFNHEGRKAYCFISADAKGVPPLAPHARVAVEGEWSSALLLVFSARRASLLAA